MLYHNFLDEWIHLVLSLVQDYHCLHQTLILIICSLPLLKLWLKSWYMYLHMMSTLQLLAWNLLLHVYLWNHWPMCSEAKANSESVRVMSAFMLDFLKSVQTNVSLQGHTVVGSLSLSLYLCVCLFPSNNKRDRQTDKATSHAVAIIRFLHF